MANSAEQKIIDRLAQAPTFHPSGAKLFVPDWTLDPGDVVTVTAKDNVNDPTEEPKAYQLPIYSMNFQWNGNGMAEVQSTGNQKREPLSALRRKEYQSGRRGYGQFKEVEQEFKEFETWKVETDETLENHAGQFVEIEGEVEGVTDRLEIAETTIGQTATDAYIVATASGILLDENGHPVLDEHGHYQYDPDAGDTTLTARINANATEIDSRVTREELGTTLSSYLLINDFGTELGTTLDNGTTVLAAKIITAIDKNTNTSQVRISASQINLDGYVTSTVLDTRLLNADSLFTDTGYADYIKAGSFVTRAGGSVTGDSIYATGSLSIGSGTSGGSGTLYYRGAQYDGKNVTVGGVQVQNIKLLANLSGNLTAVALPDAIASIAVDTNPPEGKIGFKYTTIGNSTPVPINFNIADTAAYKNGVASARMAVGLAPLSYTEIVGGNYPSSQTIYTDTTGRTDASGTDANLHRDITISLDVDNNYVYMKHGSDVIARIANPGSGTSFDAGYAAGQQNTNAYVGAMGIVNRSVYYSSDTLWFDAYANPILELTSHDTPPVVTPVAKTPLEDTLGLAVEVTPVSQGTVSYVNGVYTVGTTGGNVNIGAVSGTGGANIPVSVGQITVTPTEAIAEGYLTGQNNVSASFELATPTSGTTPQPLSAGTYALNVIRDTGTTAAGYYSVSSAGGDIDVVKGNWASGSGTYNCEFSPSSGNGVHQFVRLGTDPYIPVAVGDTLSGEASVMLRDSGNFLFSVPVYLQQSSSYAYITSNNSTPSLYSNVLARIRLQGSAYPDLRSVSSISDITLLSSQTQTSTHQVTVHYDDQTTGTASVDVDASAISTPSQRVATGLSDTIILPATHKGTARIDGNYVVYDDDSETGDFPVTIDASLVYQQGRTDGAGQIVNGHITSISKYLVDNVEQVYDPTNHRYTVHVKAEGTNVDNSPYTQDILVSATRAYNQGAQESVTGFRYDGTAIGNIQNDHVNGDITVTALNGSTTIATDTVSVYLVQGSWNSSNRKAVNIRMADSSNTLIARTWVDAPSVSHNITCSAVSSYSTSQNYDYNRTVSSGYKYHIITVSCGGESKRIQFTISG